MGFFVVNECRSVSMLRKQLKLMTHLGDKDIVMLSLSVTFSGVKCWCHTYSGSDVMLPLKANRETGYMKLSV